jgi:hypothetical protein
MMCDRDYKERCEREVDGVEVAMALTRGVDVLHRLDWMSGAEEFG